MDQGIWRAGFSLPYGVIKHLLNRVAKLWHPAVTGNNLFDPCSERIVSVEVISELVPLSNRAGPRTAQLHLSSLSPLHQMGMIAALKSMKPQTFLIIFPLGAQRKIQSLFIHPEWVHRILETNRGLVWELDLMIRFLHFFKRRIYNPVLVSK